MEDPYAKPEYPMLGKITDEFNDLKKRADLLDKLLRYYDPAEKIFMDVPAEWKSKMVHPSKLPAANPREHLYDQIIEVLSPEEFTDLLHK